MTRTTLKTGLIGAALMLAAVGIARSQMPDPPERRVSQRAQFMRVKLDQAKEALEGITLEDYDRIVRSARSLKQLSMAAEWNVPSLPKLEYVRYTTDFQRWADAMGKAGREQNLEAATLAYLQLTVSCVTCHKEMRLAKP